MRLAQIARKVEVKPEEIRSFIKEQFDVELDKDPNIKIEDEQVEAILEHFKKEEVVEEVKEEKKAPVEEIIPEDEVDPNVSTDIETLKELAEEATPDKIEIPEIAAVEEETPTEEGEEESTTEAASAKEVVEIKHADPEEVAAAKEAAKEEDPKTFDEVEVDEEAALIAARAEKLEGIKVVGKIDLSEPEPEEEELPSADAIEEEIDSMDGEVDTSGFPDLTEDQSDEEKEAIFAELDAQMDQGKGNTKVKQVTNEASEVKENLEEEEEEFSIYKNKRGIYRFTAEQRANRKKSLAIKEERERIQAQKEKKKRHYEENVAPKVAPPKKKKNKPSKKAKKKAEQKEAPKGLWQKFLNWLND